MKINNNTFLSSNQSGFTLIEMVGVIIILGILAVVTLPRFINIRSDANLSVINGAVGAIKSAVSLFKAKSLVIGHSLASVEEFEGVKGSHYQPWAATATTSGFSADYSSPPEIFEGAGLNVEEWAYRIHVSNGSYAVVATPKNMLNMAQPTSSEVKATLCYFQYHWKASGEPELTVVSTGC